MLRSVYFCPMMMVCWLSPGTLFADELTKLEDIVTVKFPKEGYTFTLAEAAQGITIEYTIAISEDVADVYASGQGPSYAEPAGASGLYPREHISGNNQGYALLDFGLAHPPNVKPVTLKKGEHKHSFTWDGRNWSGPSDTSNPKGKPFPAGKYEILITIIGEQKTSKNNVPYNIMGKSKLVLKK